VIAAIVLVGLLPVLCVGMSTLPATTGMTHADVGGPAVQAVHACAEMHARCCSVTAAVVRPGTEIAGGPVAARTATSLHVQATAATAPPDAEAVPPPVPPSTGTLLRL
jgi:hypothetical protein